MLKRFFAWVRRLFYRRRTYWCRTCTFASNDIAAARTHDASGHQVLIWRTNAYQVLSEVKGA